MEGSPGLRSYCLERLRHVAIDPSGTLLTSRIAHTECMVLPIRERQPERAQRFETFFTDSGIWVADVSNDVLSLASQVRANTRLKLVDAIHVATAIRFQADRLLTRDSDICNLRELQGVTFEAIPDLR
ncbi:MAG: PIN domain-containing protein [Vicinamibacteria bacterium]